jgi:hypothetical protein
VAALIAEHRALAEAIGDTPSEWACYRFAKKLREHKPLLDACLDRVAGALSDELPELGMDVAIDGSDLVAWANGQRFVRKGGPERETFSDPGCFVGTPERRQYAKGRRVLRLQAPRGGLRPHRPTARLESIRPVTPSYTPSPRCSTRSPIAASQPRRERWRPRRRRARVRALEERVRTIAASRPRHRAGRAPRRPDDARPPQRGARPSAGRSARALETAVCPR